MRPMRFPHERAPRRDRPGFDPLQLVAAQLLIATAAEVAMSASRTLGAPALPARVPSLLAPVAAGAHLAHMARPSEGTSIATRIFDTAVLAAAAGTGLAGIVTRTGRRGKGKIASLALASAGLLGLIILDREREEAEARRRLEKRASVVDRLVPPRRARLDHIVVHV